MIVAADPTHTRLNATLTQTAAESKHTLSFVIYPCTLTALMDILSWSDLLHGALELAD